MSCLFCVWVRLRKRDNEKIKEKDEVAWCLVLKECERKAQKLHSTIKISLGEAKRSKFQSSHITEEKLMIIGIQYDRNYQWHFLDFKQTLLYDDCSFYFCE